MAGYVCMYLCALCLQGGDQMNLKTAAGAKNKWRACASSAAVCGQHPLGPRPLVPTCWTHAAGLHTTLLVLVERASRYVKIKK